MEGNGVTAAAYACANCGIAKSRTVAADRPTQKIRGPLRSVNDSHTYTAARHITAQNGLVEAGGRFSIVFERATGYSVMIPVMKVINIDISFICIVVIIINSDPVAPVCPPFQEIFLTQ